MIIVYYHI